MRIWRATENDTQLRFFHFATKAEATAHQRNYRKDMREVQANDPHASGSCEVEPLDVKPTRRGIAKALDNLLAMTCFNEG